MTISCVDAFFTSRFLDDELNIFQENVSRIKLNSSSICSFAIKELHALTLGARETQTDHSVCIFQIRLCLSMHLYRLSGFMFSLFLFLFHFAFAQQIGNKKLCAPPSLTWSTLVWQQNVWELAQVWVCRSIFGNKKAQKLTWELWQGRKAAAHGLDVDLMKSQRNCCKTCFPFAENKNWVTLPLLWEL